jgi:hypothetical protein
VKTRAAQEGVFEAQLHQHEDHGEGNARSGREETQALVD